MTTKQEKTDAGLEIIWMLCDAKDLVEAAKQTACRNVLPGRGHIIDALGDLDAAIGSVYTLLRQWRALE